MVALRWLVATWLEEDCDGRCPDVAHCPPPPPPPSAPRLIFTLASAIHGSGGKVFSWMLEVILGLGLNEILCKMGLLIPKLVCSTGGLAQSISSSPM